jgi:hypothetical protein
MQILCKPLPLLKPLFVCNRQIAVSIFAKPMTNSIFPNYIIGHPLCNRAFMPARPAKPA